jgi:Xaa-Pro dipeptidase
MTLPVGTIAPVASGTAAPFPTDEYDARVLRVREAMHGLDVGTLLLTSPEDIYYLVGLDHLGYFAFTALLLAIDGPPVLVARAMERPTVELQTPRCAFVPYGDEEDPADAVAGALRRLGSTPAPVGVDRSTMSLPLDVWARVRERLPGLAWTDASALVRRIRMVKSPREIEHVRAAAAISDRALQAGLAIGGEGVSEREIAAAVYRDGPELRSHVYGLGGRDLHPDEIRGVLDGEGDAYVGLRSARCPA